MAIVPGRPAVFAPALRLSASNVSFRALRGRVDTFAAHDRFFEPTHPRPRHRR